MIVTPGRAPPPKKKNLNSSSLGTKKMQRETKLGMEFPFMIIWIVDKQKADSNAVIHKVRQLSLDALDPSKTGFTCSHYFDTFEEVATLARPPLGKSR
ncbi:hypothetical protein SK128_018722 [Halocaridina rubra]|uniref:Uncharacterized protein n=1 Tax=Halocaridina rubra TaxID=373956 RepID=A0AAN9A8Y7_HALRR